MNFIDLKRQYHLYKEEIDGAIKDVVESGRFVLGDQVKSLEKELGLFTGAPYAIGVSSGTDALILCLMALGVGPGKVVVTTPFSFFATVEAILLLGAEPAFCDIDPDTFNLDPGLLEDVLDGLLSDGRDVCGVIAVSLYGQCADFQRINRICEKRGLFVIEDACQSLGASFKDKMSGNLTPLAATSFFPSKPLGCFGDGGMVFTKSEPLFERIRALRVHGDTGRYQHKYIGLNARLDEIQAAVLRVKLRHFKKEIELRQDAAKRYSMLLQTLENQGLIKLPRILQDSQSVFAQYTIRILSGRRDDVARFLKEQGVPTAVHYPEILPKMKPLEGRIFKREAFNRAELAARQVLSLPMHAFIEEREQEQVAEALSKAFEVF